MSESSPLVSAEWLERRLGRPDLVVIEVSWREDDGGYRSGHVPGARWRFWKDFLWHADARDFPGTEEMARRLGALGIGPETTVVLYGDPVQFGTYAFWVLEMMGHRHLRLLDGGKERWVAAGFPTETDAPDVVPRPYAPAREDGSSRVGRDGVLAALERGDHVLLDLRSDEEYRGERVSPVEMAVDHGAERKGRIPGARHLRYTRLLNDDGTFRSAGEARRLLHDLGVGLDDSVITYCRLSHRATLGWFVLTKLLAARDVRVYDGSWTEWGSMVGMPVER